MDMSEPVQHRAPMVDLEPNVGKIIDAIAFIIAEAQRRGMSATQYTILKVIFLADKSHLNLYARPVTFDNYVAMKDGPVASLAYNFLKEDKHAMRRHKIDRLPWKRTPVPETGSGRYYYSDAEPQAEGEVLSPSDIEALSGAFSSIQHLTYTQIRRLVHSDPAYIEAWNRDGGAKAYRISYGMIFDAPNYDAAKVVEYLSKQK